MVSPWVASKKFWAKWMTREWKLKLRFANTAYLISFLPLVWLLLLTYPSRSEPKTWLTVSICAILRWSLSMVKMHATLTMRFTASPLRLASKKDGACWWLLQMWAITLKQVVLLIQTPMSEQPAFIFLDA